MNATAWLMAKLTHKPTYLLVMLRGKTTAGLQKHASLPPVETKLPAGTKPHETSRAAPTATEEKEVGGCQLYCQAFIKRKRNE